jgi:hypothetical protein
MFDAIFNKVVAGFGILITAVSSLLFPQVQAPSNQIIESAPSHEERINDAVENDQVLGANQINFIGGKTYYLSGSGISSSDTTIPLTSFTLPTSNALITTADIGSIVYITLEPQSTTKKEFVSCTTVTQNQNGTASLSGCTRGLQFTTPYTASSTLRKSHAGGTSVVISNPPQLYNEAAFKGNNETITGSWAFPSPTASTSPVTLGYFLSAVSGSSTLTFDKIAVQGTAGESISAGNLVYLRGSDQRWYKVNASLNQTTIDTIVGIAQGAGTTGNTITSGVLVRGTDSNQSGLTAGLNYFASTTAGAIGTATTTVPVGVALSATSIHFDKYFTGLAKTNATNTYSGVNTFTATTTLATTTTIGSTYAFNIGKNMQVFTATTTTGLFTVPNGITKVMVEVVGGGGGGGNANGANTGAAGGGGAGYGMSIVDVSATTTIVVTVGGGGTGNNNGVASSFSSFCTAAGGVGGVDNVAGTGGSGSGCDINVTGQSGASVVDAGATDNDNSGNGGSSHFGGGGRAGQTGNSNGQNGGNYGGGGGGALSDGSGVTGGTGGPGIVIVRW